MQALPAALAPLGARAQWVTWYAWPHPVKPGKFDKIPCDWRTGAPCNAHDPANWTDAATALAAAQSTVEAANQADLDASVAKLKAAVDDLAVKAAPATPAPAPIADAPTDAAPTI